MCITDDCLEDTFKYNYCKNCYFIRRRECLEYHKCFICDCKLRPFKSSREWNNRYLHEKCWLEYREYFY